ncbi:hypothetical protein C0Q70_02688 [Pomacea canaliculata]|uniref:Coiled-coil domain-containing protein 13 n=1 Tax=Pomacea canaliculata TaxID=400727 RepID=A0A2T7PQN7_POMCA|nr:coiled-coil domain-containing protein 13-like isoform X1 [Pomacea canaliculata]XP_025083641.1 coiled-coil domain-containing protein 13-like isoform X1 [Pomacea canaliculata]PVD35725.1 hypothetical protein C0Q70_02688 [Pomacea canaliculata]
MESTGASDTLKQQFRMLQEQQQKRLMLRLQRKEEKEKNNKSNSAQNSTPNYSGNEFGVSDTLNLKLGEKAVPIPSYLSEELVDHLNTQIREMKDENGRLFKLLSEKDFEIRQLKKKKADEKTAVMESQLTNETAATKIVELSKKIRELNAELESERTKCKQFQRKCQELQQLVSQANTQGQGDIQSLKSGFGSVVSLQSMAERKEQDEVDVKALQDKLRQTELKMADYRNQCQILKQEIKVAHKVLSQELGETANLQTLLNNPSNFRGRAQQIVALQNKVEELKVQLESQNSSSIENEVLGKGSTARRHTQDEKYREELRRLEKERREAQEREANNKKALEEEFHNQKQRMEAAKARNKILASEIKMLKQQVQTLLKKGQNDDELIQALMKQQTQLKQMLEESNVRKSDAEQKKEEAVKHLSQRNQQDNNVVGQLKAIVAEKESKVKQLEQELQQLQKDKIQNANHNEWSSFTLETQPKFVNSWSDHDTVVLASISPPHSRQSQRPSSVHNDTERAVSRGSAMGQSQRPSSVHTDTGRSSALGDEKKIQGDLQYQCQEYHTLLRAASVERERLSQLVQVVQNRLTQESLALAELQSELQAVRRQNVDLEKQLGRQQLDLTMKTGKKKGAGRTVLTTDGEDSIGESEPATGPRELQEILAMMEIQKDEIEALKAALQRTLQAKEEDLKLYSTTIEETKTVFLEALRHLKQSKLQQMG